MSLLYLNLFLKCWNIAYISQNHTTVGGVLFFELVYFVAKKTRNFGPFWLFPPQNYALFGVFLQT